MYEWETRMLLKHYLEQGVSKAELSRRFGVNRRTIHNWVTTGQLDRDPAAGARGYSPCPPVAHKLDPTRRSSTRVLRRSPSSRRSGCSTKSAPPTVRFRLARAGAGPSGPAGRQRKTVRSG